MKLSSILIAAVSAAVLASCNKADGPEPAKPEQQTNETPNNNPDGTHPYYCPACGLG